MKSSFPRIGFTFLRNAIRYDYPFRESLASLAPLVDEIVVAVGKSEDGTLEALQELQVPLKLHLIETVWDDSLREGGKILSQQTNIALAELRRRHPKSWAIYLQGDELLCENEHAIIQSDLAHAEQNNEMAVRFRYLHFWKNPNSIAIGKRWYPQEIRAIRADSKFISYGDAQSFQGDEGVRESDAFIFHYGHVREEKAYESKKRDFHRLWHGDHEIAKRVNKGESEDSREATLPYFGPQPEAIRARHRKLFGPPASPPERVLLFGDPANYPPKFASRIDAKQVEWTIDLETFLSRKNVVKVALKPLRFTEKLRALFSISSGVPPAMKSKNARRWPLDFQAILKLSEKGVPFQ